MVKEIEPEIEEITMTVDDMKNVILILLENTAASLFMHNYHDEALKPNECADMAIKLKEIVIKLRELIF